MDGEMCGCSITARLENKMMDDLHTAKEANMRIYKWGMNEASHTHNTDTNLCILEATHTRKVLQKYRDERYWKVQQCQKDADIYDICFVSH